MFKTAVISGISGMDGFYLSHYLLSIGYKVVGIMRRSSVNNEWRLKTIMSNTNFSIVYGDITDQASISEIISEYKPDEFYHLAANSFVGCSWSAPNHVIETNTMGTVNCLEAIRQNHKECKFYFAGSSEMYGDYVRRTGGKIVLNEDSPMIAASPYGVSKVAGYQMTKVYRESYDMFASCGILFNHCAPLRGEEFFTRKITSQLARVYWDMQSKVIVGNLAAQRDEGFSLDYVKAMHLMLQHNEPDDFVIATGETHSCQEWVDLSLENFNLQPNHIEVSERFFRPNEVNILIGDASKAKSKLGWSGTVPYKTLNKKMCDYDLHSQCPTQSSLMQKADQFIF